MLFRSICCRTLPIPVIHERISARLCQPMTVMAVKPSWLQNLLSFVDRCSLIACYSSSLSVGTVTSARTDIELSDVSALTLTTTGNFQDHVKIRATIFSIPLRLQGTH